MNLQQIRDQYLDLADALQEQAGTSHRYVSRVLDAVAERLRSDEVHLVRHAPDSLPEDGVLVLSDPSSCYLDQAGQWVFVLRVHVAGAAYERSIRLRPTDGPRVDVLFDPYGEQPDEVRRFPMDAGHEEVARLWLDPLEKTLEDPLRTTLGVRILQNLIQTRQETS